MGKALTFLTYIQANFVMFIAALVLSIVFAGIICGITVLQERRKKQEDTTNDD